MASVTLSLCRCLEDNAVTKKILEGFTIIGDNAYVQKFYMAIPLKGLQTGWKDGYNFYLSQLRITIERAFGVFVHRWAILRAPLTIPLQRVAPLIESLVRLHNFCINESEVQIDGLQARNVKNLHCNVWYSRQDGSADTNIVEFDGVGRPLSLLGHGQHFLDTSRYDRNVSSNETPMKKMLETCRLLPAVRPKYQSKKYVV